MSRRIAVAACVPLLAAMAPGQAVADLGERVQAALEKARPALLRHLERSGDRGGHVRPGALALVCLAALHDGVPTDHPVLAAALERLARAQPHLTYDLALRLMVMEAHAEFPDREHIARSDLRDLLQHRDRGAFSYAAQPDGWDLSNTQYAALGLRAAESIGVRVPKRVWLDLLQAVARAQLRDGSFSYMGRHTGGGYSSMTVAGIAVMEICSQALEEQARKPKGVKPRIEAAWKWMARNRSDIGSLETRACYYFHYGLERAAILSEVERVGTADWYADGARMLVDAQLAGGGWESETDHTGSANGDPAGNLVATSFAILFLRRKFQRVAGPLTGPRGPSLDGLDDQSSDDDVQAAARTAWSTGRRAMPDVLKALRSQVAARRRAAAIALYRIAGEDFGYNPHRGEEHNRDAIRAAELWYLENK